MAEVLLYSFNFTANNPSGTFVAGDVVDVYVETDDIVTPAFITFDGISVKKNGVLIGSGPIIDTLPKSYKTETDYNQQICKGDTLVKSYRYLSFPYVYYHSWDNYPSCVGLQICDLAITGPPDILVKPTDASSATGSIRINASSSGAIQYKLGSDFVYGEGQSSNTFTGLIAGTYRVYIRDEKNCAVNTVVVLPVDNSFGVRFRMEYDDLAGGTTRVDILKRAYYGDILEVCGTENPFEYGFTGEGSRNKFEPLMSIKMTARLQANDNNSLLKELYTNDTELFRLKFYKNTSIEIPALSTFVNIAGPGVNWSTGAAPSVSLGAAQVSDDLSGTVTGIGAEDVTVNYDISLDVFSSVDARIAFYASGVSIYSNTIHLVAGSNTGSAFFPLTSIPDSIRVIVSNLSAGARVVTVNSLKVDFKLKLIGKVLPQQYQSAYLAPPLDFAQFDATDGLASLSKFLLVQDDGQTFYGTVKLIKLVAYILNKIGFDLPIRVACNLYAETMDQADSDDPFDQAYCDYDAFNFSGQDITLDFVMRCVLEPFGARLTQWDGRWNIVRTEEMTGDYDYRDFDKDGDYISSGTYSPVDDIVFPSQGDGFIFANASQGLEIIPGAGLLKVKYHLGLKPNIIRNGDFRIKAVYNSFANQYDFRVNKDGFQLVDAGYALAEFYEPLEGKNVAILIQGGGPSNQNTGNAYLLSDSVNIKMGSANQLKLSIRYKIPQISILAGSVQFTANIPYVKIRMIIKYGNYYLRTDGSWVLSMLPPTEDEEYVFYTTDYGKYAINEVTAPYPNAVAADGLDFSVQVFHAYVFHADYYDLAAFKAYATLFKGEGTKKTFRTDDYFASDVYTDKLLYYELTNTTEAEDIPNIVRPDDYLDSVGDPDHNPKQWVLKYAVSVTPYAAIQAQFWIDYIDLDYLTNGEAPIDTVVRSRAGEVNNIESVENDLYLGSYTELIVSEQFLDDRYSFINPAIEPIKKTDTINVLSGATIYNGYLRDADGVGYDNWKRDSVTELDKLHGIYLNMVANQYNRQTILLRCDLKNKFGESKYFSLLNILREVNDSNRLYLPIGVTINDKTNTMSGELLEIININDDPGSDGSSGTPYSSGFSIGFGQSGFN